MIGCCLTFSHVPLSRFSDVHVPVVHHRVHVDGKVPEAAAVQQTDRNVVLHATPRR